MNHDRFLFIAFDGQMRQQRLPYTYDPSEIIGEEVSCVIKEDRDGFKVMGSDRTWKKIKSSAEFDLPVLPY